MSIQQFRKMLFASFFLICISSFSQEAKNPIIIDDILNLKTVREPKISPDGKWIAFTVSTNDLKKDKSEKRIWMISTSGGNSIPMTGKGYSASEPRWSRDNKYLSFLASKGDDKTQVWTLNRLGGEAEQLTNVVQGVSGHIWSPDGKRLLLQIRDPKPEELTKDKEDDKKAKPIIVDRLQFKRDYQGYLNRYRTHLYTFSPGDSIAIQITSGDYNDSNPVWSPDGKSVAFVSNRTENADANTNTDIWIVATDNSDKGKTLFQLTKNENSDISPAWSNDGKHICYLTVTDKEAIWYATQKLAIIPAIGGKPKLLVDNLDRNKSKPSFSEDGKSVYFILEEQGTKILASVNINGKGFKRVINGEISLRDYAIDGSQIISLLGESQQPFEIYSFKYNQLNKLTGFNNQVVEGVKKPLVEKIHFKSKDGTPIEGFVVKPVDFEADKKYPTILWIHGGPVSQYDYSYHPISQIFAANGYVVLLINPRGSSGYGQDFSKAIFADWGNKDFEDVMAGVDYAIKSGYADAERLGVGGWSYGGILTDHVITKTNRFKAAISGASEALYRSNYGHDQYQNMWEAELGLPWEHAEAWERISPFNKVANITTPTLWMGGSDDWNVPIINSEQMYQAMKRLGIETQLIVYPGEHHGFKRPSFIKDRYERFLGWFDKYVK